MQKLIVILVSILAAGCAKPKSRPEAKPTTRTESSYYWRNLHSMVRIMTFDQFNQKLSDGYGVYVEPDIVVTSLSWLRGAFRAKMMPIDSRATDQVFGYVAVDADADLVALRVAKRSENVVPIDSIVSNVAYSLNYVDKKTLKTAYAIDSLSTLSPAGAYGLPLFSSNGSLCGVSVLSGKVSDCTKVSKLLKGHNESHSAIFDLRLKSNRKYIHHSKVAGCRIVTDAGDIEMSLSDQTPAYRDNFIRLVSDGFYDSLLVHRVLPKFLIQMGAADSKYAKADDVVGWQGPGYTLPMDIKPHLFHSRGAIAASKMPADRNPKNRSDGSQFFIIAGRRFEPAELDQLERDKHIKFTSEQRQIFTTVGGAPYLDGDYTVFAKVTNGMNVVDRISQMAVNGDRPIKDIRIKRIELILRK